MSIDWFNPPLHGAEETGLNEAGIQSFKDVESLARETIQNILDNPDDSGAPRIVEFDFLELPSAEFPGIKTYRNTMNAVKQQVLAQLGGDGSGNEKAFFQTAENMLQAEHIPVLRIGDYNTTGLGGSDSERDSAYYRLLRSQGFSTTQGKGGGSYGIGQRAPFAASAVRAVFYSSRRQDNSVIFIGKSILASHPEPFKPDQLRHHVGWWCRLSDPEKGKWTVVSEEHFIPARFRRTEVGTDLFIMGFTQQAEWERNVRHSALHNFFAAILEQDLVVRILKDGELLKEISHVNLEEELRLASEEAFKEGTIQEWRDGVGSALYFYKALTQPLGNNAFTGNLPDIGECRLYVYRDPKDACVPERWAYMRAPKMLINVHGSKLLSNYAAVFVCDNPTGNLYLRDLEDPKHRRWHQDELRGATDAQRKKAKDVLAAVHRFVRETLKEISAPKPGEYLDVPLLGRYLPAEESEEDESFNVAKQRTEEITSIETAVKAAKPLPVKTALDRTPSREAPTLVEPVELPGGGEGGGGPGGNTTTGGTQPGTGGPGTEGAGGGGPGEGEKEPMIRREDVRFRSFRTANEYMLVLEGKDTVSGHLDLRAVGEDGQQRIAVESAVDTATGNPLETAGSIIMGISVNKGAAVRIRVKLASDIPCTLSLGQ